MNENFNVPWRLYEEFVLDSEGSLIGQIEEMGGLEIARRIVACVNFCKGLSTENMENDTLESSLKEVLERVKNQRDEATAQRDELLAALKDIRDMSLNPAHTMTYSGLEGAVDGCHKTALMYLEKHHA